MSEVKGLLIAGAILTLLLIGMGMMMMLSAARPAQADYEQLAAQRAALESMKRQAELMNEMNRLQMDPASFHDAMRQYHGN